MKKEMLILTQWNGLRSAHFHCRFKILNYFRFIFIFFYSGRSKGHFRRCYTWTSIFNTTAANLYYIKQEIQVHLFLTQILISILIISLNLATIKLMELQRMANLSSTQILIFQLIWGNQIKQDIPLVNLKWICTLEGLIWKLFLYEWFLITVAFMFGTTKMCFTF